MTSAARSAWREAVRIRPVDADWAFAFRAGLAVAVPMAGLVALGEPGWAATAAFGSFTALYARDELYRPRSRQLALVALGLVAAVTVGTVAALIGGVAPIVVVALVGGVATWLCTAFRVGPPAGLMFAFAAAVASALPVTAGAVWRNAALAAGAAAWAWLVALAGAAVDRDAPRRLAVARALRAVAALEDVAPRTSGLVLRHRAAVAVERAWRALPARPPSGPRGALIADLEALTAHAESAFAAVHVEGEAARRAPSWAPGGTAGPPDSATAGVTGGTAHQDSAAASSGGGVSDAAESSRPAAVPEGTAVPRRTAVPRPLAAPDGTDPAAAAGRASGDTAERVDHGGAPVDWAGLRGLAAQVGRSGPIPRVRRSRAEIAQVAGRHLAAELGSRPRFLRPDPADPRRTWLGGPAIPVAVRVVLGALAAGALATLPARDADLGHGYWAAVSAVAVLQTPNLLGSVHRTVQRALGTVLGVALAAAAVVLLPGQWSFVAAIVLLQVVAELLVVRNYGLAMLAVTPLAILAGELAHPAPATGLVRDRLLQTVLGAVVGLLCAVLIRNRAAVRHLESVTAACRAAVGELRERLADPGADPLPAARRVATLLTAVREAHDVVSGEPGRTPTDAEMVLRTEQRARHALTAAATRLTAQSNG
ncbi:putative membrane protein YccC [Catenuloplanes nepalensis]|uniref:Membrane protein YccC n=1 Tax=Catenuloplanes nepalensis TaxID=587533 RepID=A0ABT9MKM6_9ACTN|nr:FUSC family protein [Catenuloplanes nepalensis]MDP9791944.1 putative membrane protein YccC [Catenuloplanes nepalensis]